LVTVVRHIGEYGFDANTFGYPLFRELGRRMHSFSGALAYVPALANLNMGNATERVRTELVSGSSFQVLGVHGVLGRVLTPEDDGAEGGHPVCVISYCFRQDASAVIPRNYLGRFSSICVVSRSWVSASPVLKVRFTTVTISKCPCL
jgi:hypothetical protein